MSDIYNSIAAKLNYELQTKESIKQAIINKGVQVSDKLPFREYPNKIESIVTGGGFFGTITPNETIWINDQSFSMLSDVVLAENLDINDFTLSDNVEKIERIDNLNFQVILKEPLKTNDKISIETKETAYLNNNGVGNKFTKFISLPQWEDYQNDSRHMTPMRTSTGRADSWSSGTIKYTDSNGLQRIWSADSEGIINMDGFPGYAILFYNRDGSISQFWWTRCEHLEVPFTKFRGLWYQPYNVSLPNTEAEFFIFDTSYHMYIHGLKFPETTGTNRLCGITTYDCNAEKPKVSAYRKNFLNYDYEIIYDDFDFGYARQRDEDMYAKGTIDDFVTNYYLEKFNDMSEHPEYAQLVTNVKNDGGCMSIRYIEENAPIMPIYTKNGKVTSISSHGDSYFTLSGMNVMYSNRDASQYYAHIRNCKLTDMNNMRAVQFIWIGSAHWNGEIDLYWSLWFFENDGEINPETNMPYPNDAMIYVDKNSKKYATNECSFFGVNFNKVDDNSYVSFYWNKETKTYDVIYDKYRLKK